MEINDLTRDELLQLVALLGKRVQDAMLVECRSLVAEANVDRMITQEAQKTLDISKKMEDVKNKLVDTELKLAKTMSDLIDANAKYGVTIEELGKVKIELANVRRSVMDEVSGMIKNGVEAERRACTEIARNAALTCSEPSNSAAIMTVVNAIQMRNK